MQGYSYVRICGTDCNQVELAIQYARQYGMKVFAGMFSLNNIQSQADIIISAVNGTWDIIDTISVGNEDVNNGTPVSSVVSAMSQAKSILRAAGYSGDIVHIDSQNAFQSNPELCTPEAAGSYVAANCHPFFNSQTPADQAAAFVSNEINILGSCAASVGNSRVRITETGWPKQGQNDGAAVPSKENQNIVINGIKGLSNADTAIFLSSFNDPWKAPGAFNSEQFWGILDD
jgi:exo-beta-1,3-glucanase (GH17 family)